MRSLTLSAMTAVEQPALTLSCGGLTSATSELTLLPESVTVRMLLMLTREISFGMLLVTVYCEVLL